jgi:hypothetical protein
VPPQRCIICDGLGFQGEAGASTHR